MIILGGLCGPFGIFTAIFELGDAAYAGASNIRGLRTYYYLDYFTISASYNLLILLGIGCIGLLIKGFKVQLSRILKLTLYANLCNIPAFVVSLLLTFIPTEGNIKGFFIFPVFIIVSVAGGIGFIVMYAILLYRIKPEKSDTSQLQSLQPYLLTVVAVLLLQFLSENEGTTSTTIVSFEHEDFSWWITRESRSKAGVQNKKKSDPYFVHIKHKNKNDKTQVILSDSHHSLYKIMRRVIPVQKDVILLNNSSNSSLDFYSHNYEVFLSDKDNKPLHRIKAFRKPQTIYISASKSSDSIAKTIANDLLKAQERGNLNKTDEDLIIESVSIGQAPDKEGEIFYGEGNKKITIDSHGLVRLVMGMGKFDPIQDLGDIREGTFYSYRLASNMRSYVKKLIKRVPYEKFKNTQNKTLPSLYPHVDGTKCASNISYAMEKCRNIETLYLADPVVNKSIPKTVYKFNRLLELNTSSIEIGTLTDQICKVRSLRYISIDSSTSVTLPKCLKNMPDLTYVGITHSNLNKVPEVIKEMKKIRDLNVSGNNITKIPKELASNEGISSITVDFNENLEIPKEFLTISNFFMEFVTYNEEQTGKAEDFLKKLNKATRQENALNMFSWSVIRDY